MLPARPTSLLHPRLVSLRPLESARGRSLPDAAASLYAVGLDGMLGRHQAAAARAVHSAQHAARTLSVSLAISRSCHRVEFCKQRRTGRAEYGCCDGCMLRALAAMLGTPRA